MSRIYRDKFVKDMVVARKNGAKIVTAGTFVAYRDVYINYKGKDIALSVVDLLENCAISTSPKNAKELGHDVVRLSKTDADKQIFIYAHKDKICNVIGYQLCKEDGTMICYLPCQQFDPEDYVTSPLLEQINEKTALIKMHFVATNEGSVVVQATYINLDTHARSSRTIAIKEDGKTYDVASSKYTIEDAQKKANITKEHKNLPLLAQISLYGDALLNPLLKTIHRKYDITSIDLY